MTVVAEPVADTSRTSARARQATRRRFLQRYATLLILLGLCLVFTIIGPWRTAREACDLGQQIASFSLVKNGQLCGPVFASQVNLLNLVRQVSVIGIVALGEMLVILTGGIDLGVGSIVGFSGVIAAALQRGNAGLVPTLLISLGVGSLTGVIVGLLVTKGNIPSFVATLGVLAGLQGATLVFTNAQPITGLKEDFRFIGTGYVGDIPVPIVIYVVAIALCAVLLGRTSLGRSIYAIGGNDNAARLSGIRVDLVRTIVFVISGLGAALGALILTARLNSGQPQSGQGYELDAIASVVIGGTSLSGGRGTVFGTVAGALLIGVLSNGLVLMNVSPYYQPIIKGAIIVGAVLLDQVGRRRSR
jgi:ribose/xylose/arabinose/galactoside ABC-type transport system permease subunit